MVACLVLISAGSVSAAGFALIEQSVSGMGNAYAGGAAVAEDATTIFFNPAGMTRLDKRQVVSGLHLIKPSAKYRDSGSTTVLGAALIGGDGGDGGSLAAAPNFYYAMPLENGLVIGVGVNSPFGLATKYDSDWIGRYHGIESEVKTVNVNPSIAYKFGDMLSVGAGVNIQYLEAKLSNAIDFGTLDAVSFGGAFSLTPQGDDGYVTLKGDSIAYGYNLGILLELSEDSRIGLAYRSKISHKVEGDADFTNSPAGIVAATGGWFTDTDVKATVELPSSFSISAYHRFNSTVAIMADATRTNWSSFKELRFAFASGQPDGVTTESWQDSWRYSLGATITPNDVMTVRLGVAYDETPIPDSAHRTPRIPGADRTWVALGMGYKFSDAINLDVAYTHLFVKDAVIDKAATGEDALRGALTGSYDSTVDIASVQLTYRF
ncbi:MAG: aromatic hydrocarbon degradation protein [Deltaproteobacteria bacterium]|nr:aromatic hydrocarbon degradation protein [Deltaproteobacteria bacterium]